MSRVLRRLAVLVGLVLPLGVLTAPTASAHPLGRFTVNHYNGLTLHPNRLDVHAVVDSAEIPTFQSRPEVDTDGDRAISDPEASAYVTAQCDRLSRAVSATVDGEPLRFAVRSAAVSYPPGEAGLPTTRLTCELSAVADLGDAATVTFTDSFHEDRIGWREITAVGEGLRLPDAPVPARSVSDVLRNYPVDLLDNPLDIRRVTLETVPGEATAAGPNVPAVETGIAPLDRLASWVDRQFTRLVGPELTPLVGGLAVLLSLVLGAAHAVLPGHGKTLIAAYLAGRRGTTRDALIVGGSVTVTHTATVLVVGLLLYAVTSLLGEDVIGWLATVSGLLVTAIGAALLRSALRSRRGGKVDTPEPVLVGAGHGHGHGHGHGDGHGHGHGHGLAPGGRLDRSTLFGMGVAAGLVPSPSALVVLLAAVGLSQTWFGIVLVLGYGIGMAATLTAVGLLLVRLRDQLEHRLAHGWSNERLARLAAAMPVLTAVLVLVVGLGLAARGVAGTL
ncbi:MAG: High-affinity nickel-transporter [Actinomycetota bacterium]|nr:High-affinity nickel-transporter [Actinomycetota bacterium]MDQ4021063.1 High-affinity nickel-transporter [Actinomycetota bacterium]